jgi:[acyl-carrier-protein] S-malonyltransferase
MSARALEPNANRHDHLRGVIGVAEPEPIAFLFPGEASASVGMGAALEAADPARYARWMQAAEIATGLPLRRLILNGPPAALASPEAAQPAVLALSLAVAEAAGTLGLTPDYAAGHGSGAYAAAVVAGALSSDDAFALVAERGRLLCVEVCRQPGATAFVLGFAPDMVERVCAQVRQRFGYVAVASIDSPSRAVLAGNASSVERAVGLARRLGATAGLLAATDATHTLMMATVSARLARVARRMTWRDPRIPVVGIAAHPWLTSGTAIRDALIGEVTQTVRWHESMERLHAAGVRHYLEAGPGRSLTGFAARRDADAVAMAADHPAEVFAFAERVATTRRTSAPAARAAGARLAG